MTEKAEKKVVFELVTPMKLAVSENVDMVVVPGADGDFGVLFGHAPVLTTIRPGVIDIYIKGSITKSLFVEGGFAEAAAERCTVLAEAAIDLKDISIGEAESRLAAARENSKETDELAERREVFIAEALVQATGRNIARH